MRFSADQCLYTTFLLYLIQNAARRFAFLDSLITSGIAPWLCVIGNSHASVGRRRREFLKVISPKFSVQGRSTHFQLARHTGQIPSMHADRLDDQFYFNPTVRSPYGI